MVRKQGVTGEVRRAQRGRDVPVVSCVCGGVSSSACVSKVVSLRWWSQQSFSRGTIIKIQGKGQDA